MDDFLQLATAVRERYLQALLEALTDFMAEHEPAAAEVMFELERDEPLPYRLYRADMATSVDGQARVHDLNPSTHLSFEPFGIDWSDHATVAVSPFTWNDVGLHFNIRLPAEPIEQWALRWLDLEDAFEQDEHGLQSVIHSIVREDGDDGSTLLNIDFGSAPVEALAELIELGMQMGASHVSLRSESLRES